MVLFNPFTTSHHRCARLTELGRCCEAQGTGQVLGTYSFAAGTGIVVRLGRVTGAVGHLRQGVGAVGSVWHRGSCFGTLGVWRGVAWVALGRDWR